MWWWKQKLSCIWNILKIKKKKDKKANRFGWYVLWGFQSITWVYSRNNMWKKNKTAQQFVKGLLCRVEMSVPQVVKNLSERLICCSVYITVSPHEDFLRNVSLKLLEKNTPLYRSVGIEKGIKITIPACPAAPLKLLGCYMLLYAISCIELCARHANNEAVSCVRISMVMKIGIEGIYLWLYQPKWAKGLTIPHPSRCYCFRGVHWKWLPSCLEQMAGLISLKATGKVKWPK